jgi:23S rRNA (guanosine2251-2'-O)-methyltransferase
MKEKKIYLYGFHSVEAAILNNRDNLAGILVSKSRNDQRISHLLATAKEYKIEITNVDNLDNLIGTNKHQGIAAVLKDIAPPSLEFKDLLAKLDTKQEAIVLILDGITDVHNFGAIIRSADCFGVDAIIVPKNNSANINNPIVAKVSSGAINTTPVITVNNLSTTIARLKEHNFWIAGTALAENAVNLFEFKCDNKLVWIMGSEDQGIRRLVSENCDYLVTIPMQGKTQSLNVSVAAGIILAYTRFSSAHRA